jgi:hypothetical protein
MHACVLLYYPFYYNSIVLVYGEHNFRLYRVKNVIAASGLYNLDRESIHNTNTLPHSPVLLGYQIRGKRSYIKSLSLIN